MTTTDQTPVARRSLGPIGLGIFVIIFVVGLLWAKWIPYASKAWTLGGSGSWSGDAIYSSAGEAGSAPALSGAWHFTVTYLHSVWPAVLVGLVVAAAVDTLIKPAWLIRVINRKTAFGQAVAGGVASMPSMMCTCCTAPVAVGLRRRGATPVASLAYWIGNPILNPAVLVFLALVAPWQFAVVRVVIGALLVFVGTPLIARLARLGAGMPASDVVVGDAGEVADEQRSVVGMLTGFGRSLLRFSAILIPEFVGMVFVVGMFSGTFSDFSGIEGQLGFVSIVVIAVVAVALVIPTAGEIPVVLGLAAVGASSGLIGVLLIALPALSLPSMVMVGRSLSWRLTVAAAAGVVLAALLAAALLAVVMPVV